MSDPTLPESTEDSGLTRFHSESLNDNEGILGDSVASECPSCAEFTQLRASWANRLQRAITKLEYVDTHRAMKILVELKNEIRGGGE